MRLLRALLIVVVVLSLPAQGADRSAEVARKLQGFDAYVHKVLRDWNGVGIGVGVVVDDKLVFVRGYGYREYAKKQPITPQTLFQIGSNTKLFTAVAAGFLVEEGKLTWDKPIRESVPTIQFYNDALNNTVTLRDMLAHRTGAVRRDMIWFNSGYSKEQLFAQLKYVEPTAPPRQTFLYNNLMYAALGHVTVLKSGKSWEDYVQEKILTPLQMDSTVFSVAEMLKHEDRAVPYAERRDSAELYPIPYYEDFEGVAAAGAIMSDIEDMSHWLVALMNDGQYRGRQVLPSSVLKATLQPALALPNSLGNTYGWWELQNPVHGMGRRVASYRGHLLTYHAGAIQGFHSHISYMPLDRIGVIMFTIGDHTARLTDTIGYNVYERLLDMKQTPWSERWLEARRKEKETGAAARAKAVAGRVPNTLPSHPLDEYAGEYEHPAYGTLRIKLEGGQLQFDFHRIRQPLTHFHYDRFDTPDDELDGLQSVNFITDPQGKVSKLTISLDETEATFVRRERLK